VVFRQIVLERRTKYFKAPF